MHCRHHCQIRHRISERCFYMRESKQVLIDYKDGLLCSGSNFEKRKDQKNPQVSRKYYIRRSRAQRETQCVNQEDVNHSQHSIITLKHWDCFLWMQGMMSSCEQTWGFIETQLVYLRLLSTRLGMNSASVAAAHDLSPLMLISPGLDEQKIR